jgi:hypothetical protein
MFQFTLCEGQGSYSRVSAGLLTKEFPGPDLNSDQYPLRELQLLGGSQRG